MIRSLAPALAALSLAACSPSQPPEAPQTPAASSAEPAAGSEPAPSAAPGGSAAPAATVVKGGDAETKGQRLDSYELTPSDCDALGRQYGAVARADQMAGLSAKLSEKQRASTAAQVDKVVSKLEESWITGCQTNLVNKSVDHSVITCALGSKTVKQFDVCLNGEGGTPQTGGKPGKKQ